LITIGNFKIYLPKVNFLHYNVVVQSFFMCMHAWYVCILVTCPCIFIPFCHNSGCYRFKFDLSLDEIKMHKGVESLPYYFLYRVGRSWQGRNCVMSLPTATFVELRNIIDL